MEELTKLISSKMTEIDSNIKKELNGNKSAGRRARKASVELEKLLRQYRRESIAKAGGE